MVASHNGVGLPDGCGMINNTYRSDQGAGCVVIELEQKDFEELVLVALVTLPDQFRTALKNIDVVVEDFPPMDVLKLSLIHISEPTRLGMISYAVFCLKKKKKKKTI